MSEIDKVIEQHGAFWAFSNEQLNEQKVEGVEYVSLGLGLICPKDKVVDLKAALGSAIDSSVEEDIIN